jgi:hypothetical protein
VIQFREARLEDDEKLTRLVGKPMPGDLSLSMTREPSLLQACAHHGPPRRVLTAVDEGKVLAVCTYFPWDYSVRGETRRVWTVADFRAERRAASKSVTGLGWQALAERLDGQPALISLVDDNPVSYRLFSKARKGWPRLNKVANLKTLILPLTLVPRSCPEAGLIRPKTEQIVRALNQQTTHLTPVLSAEDVGRATPGPESFVACHDGCSLTACGALWDASDYRQIKIAGYSGLYARLRAVCRRFRVPLLPPPGSQVRVQFAAFLRGRCEESRRRVFLGLVEQARERGTQFLVWGQDAEDKPPFPRAWPRFTLNSSLYQLKWSEEFDLGLARSGYEVAWL